MTSLKAKEARTMTKKAKKNNINFQRTEIAKQILRRSITGYDFLVIDSFLFPTLDLNDSDYEYFKKLGYEVTFPIKTETEDGSLIFKHGVIRW